MAAAVASQNVEDPNNVGAEHKQCRIVVVVEVVEVVVVVVVEVVVVHSIQ